MSASTCFQITPILNHNVQDMLSSTTMCVCDLSLAEVYLKCLQPFLQRVFFARDPLGRRSLLVHLPSESNLRFLLTSVSIGLNPFLSVEELSTECIHFLDLEGSLENPVSNVRSLAGHIAGHSSIALR